ncbi:MAG: LLM class flavin-dependent oxidoreductase, partial [Sphingomonadales bacterium]
MGAVMTAMRFNIGLPIDQIEPKGEFQNFDALRRVSLAVEAAGAQAAGVTEHPAPDADWLHNDPAGHDTLDPFTALAFVAAVTTKLRLLTQIVVLPYRNPFLSAKAGATLQILSGNRFIFGVGAGYQRGEFEAVGVPMNKRGALTDEALETIRLTGAGGAVVKKGMFFDAKGNEPRPAPDTPPPIWLGGG